VEQRVALPALAPITSHAAMQRAVDHYLARAGLPLAFDIETTGLDPRSGHIISLQFYQEGDALPTVFDAREQFIYDREYVADLIKPLFAGKLLIVGHNLKFDFLWLMTHYQVYPTRCYDTMLAEQVLQGVGRSDAKARGVELSLKALASHYAGVTMSKAERNWFIDLDKRPDEWEAALPDEQVAYAAEDVRVLPLLYTRQCEALRKADLFRAAKLEMDALPAIASIEESGVHIDVKGWRAFIAEKEAEAREIEARALEVFGGAILAARTQEYDQKLAVWQAWEAEKKAHEFWLRQYFDENTFHLGTPESIGWGEFKTKEMRKWRDEHPNPGKPKPDQSLPNLSSPTQLVQAFQQMGIAVVSTASEVLQQVEGDHPEVQLLLDYRRAQKFVTSFGEALLQYVTPAGRIHPEYVQIGASTGRMSCTRPNWQQVPSKGDGQRLRHLVRAEPGNKLFTADFSNIELRVLADLTGDQTMLALFDSGADLHTYTARMMFGLGDAVDVKHTLMPGSDQTYRAVAKVINFGLVYGMSPTKLARTVKVTKSRAEELMDAYFALYPTVAKWMEQQKHFGVTQLYSVTRSGRKRLYSLPSDPRDPDYRMLRARVQRQAMNSPIQGTSADITKLALSNLYRSGILQNGLGYARIVAVVHDEVVLEGPEDMRHLIELILAEAMGAAAKEYLKRVALPEVEVVVADYWSKE
jgi:DNA polymerase I